MGLLIDDFHLENCFTAIKLTYASIIGDPLNYSDRIGGFTGDPGTAVLMYNMHSLNLFVSNSPDSLYESIDFSHVTAIEHLEGAPECIRITNTEGKSFMPCLYTVYRKNQFLRTFRLFELCRTGVDISTIECPEFEDTVIAKDV